MLSGRDFGRINGFQLSRNKFVELSLKQLPDENLQSVLLEGVSRTFALTIPQLPESLYSVVANAYLLCRIVDTIEDEVALDVVQKRQFCQGFIEIVQNAGDSEDFSRRLAPLLSNQTIPTEHELIRNIPQVVAITHQFETPQREALVCCVETMAGGMPEFQVDNLQHGLATMDDMSRYCYFVAGCVGEMLTKLFCHYSPEIAAHKTQLLELSVSFGQGLQMTNILKDIWDDYDRDVCWLPQAVFVNSGYDLKNLSPDHHSERFREALENLISIAFGHLQNAMRYTALIPRNETGIRDFCFWAIGMAVLTLRKIHKNPYFNESSQVKISRNSVKTTIAVSRLSRISDGLLNFIFNIVGSSLKRPEWQAKIMKFSNG